MSDQPSKTPLQDLLRAVPKDHRIEIQEGQFAHRLIPIGHHVHEAADKIDELEKNEQVDLSRIKASLKKAGYGVYHTIESCVNMLIYERDASNQECEHLRKQLQTLQKICGYDDPKKLQSVLDKEIEKGKLLAEELEEAKVQLSHLNWMVDGDIRDHVQLANKLQSEHSTEMARVMTKAFERQFSGGKQHAALPFLTFFNLEKALRWNGTAFEPICQTNQPVGSYGGPPEKLKEKWDDMAEAVREAHEEKPIKIAVVGGPLEPESVAIQKFLESKLAPPKAPDENAAWDELENILPRPTTNIPVMLKDLIFALRSVKEYNGVRGPGHAEWWKYADLADALERVAK